MAECTKPGVGVGFLDLLAAHKPKVPSQKCSGMCRPVLSRRVQWEVEGAGSKETQRGAKRAHLRGVGKGQRAACTGMRA